MIDENEYLNLIFAKYKRAHHPILWFFIGFILKIEMVRIGTGKEKKEKKTWEEKKE